MRRRNRNDHRIVRIPEPPPDKRFTYNTEFQRQLCKMGLSWKTAVITDWTSRGASIKDISTWLDINSSTVAAHHLHKAYKRLGLSGRGANLLLVGIRLRLEKP